MVTPSTVLVWPMSHVGLLLLSLFVALYRVYSIDYIIVRLLLVINFKLDLGWTYVIKYFNLYVLKY